MPSKWGVDLYNSKQEPIIRKIILTQLRSCLGGPSQVAVHPPTVVSVPPRRPGHICPPGRTPRALSCSLSRSPCARSSRESHLRQVFGSISLQSPAANANETALAMVKTPQLYVSCCLAVYRDDFIVHGSDGALSPSACSSSDMKMACVSATIYTHGVRCHVLPAAIGVLWLTYHVRSIQCHRRTCLVPSRFRSWQPYAWLFLSSVRVIAEDSVLMFRYVA